VLKFTKTSYNCISFCTLLSAAAHGSSICTSHRLQASLVALTLLAPLLAADGTMPLPVHVVIGNAGAELCWNVAPKTPNHFEVQSRPPVHSGPAMRRPMHAGQPAQWDLASSHLMILVVTWLLSSMFGVQVVELAWGYMKVDANATHIVCEVSAVGNALPSRCLMHQCGR
jgi:hypothetical protein